MRVSREFKAALDVPPESLESQQRQKERNHIASWLLCEAFENRFDPALANLLGRMARAVRHGVDPSVSLAEMDLTAPERKEAPDA